MRTYLWGTLLVLSVSSIYGDTRKITSAQLLPGAGRIDFGQLGPPSTLVDGGYSGNLVPLPVNLSSTIGVNATLNAAGNPNAPLLRGDAYNIGSSINAPLYLAGNFSEGDHILYSPNFPQFSPRKPWTFQFAQPIRGFVAQGQADIYGGYEITVSAYDANDVPLISEVRNEVTHDDYQVAGTHSAPALGNTAAVVGVFSSQRDISKVVVTVNGGTGEMLLNSPWISNVRDGDADGDGDVDSVDFDTLAAHYGSTGNTWSSGDFTWDEKVTTEDFNLLAGNFGGAASIGSMVPEPYSATTFIASIGLIVRYRRPGAA